MKFVKLLLFIIVAVIGLFPCGVNAHEKSKEDLINSKDFEVLCHVINGEAGAYYCSDELRYYVGSVVLNRVKDKEFPNTIEEVVFQQGQYGCIKDGNYNIEPSESSCSIALDLLTNGSKLPQEVVFQSQKKHGRVYCKEQNMYFCTRE